MVSSLDVRPHFFSGHNRSTSVSSTNSSLSTPASYSSLPLSKMASVGAQTYTMALQKYMLLTEQHQDLCDRLDQIRPEFHSSSRSQFSSPSTSPTRSSSSSLSLPPSPKRHSRSGRHHSRSHARFSGWENHNELTTIPDEETIYEISVEEQRLSEVNESIKRTLTELLNCSSVRADRAFRTWVQTRLMETEKELRSGRRRRSSGNE
ncbi:hypothetical protein SNK03_007334 [Fusarium graminearum]